MIFMQEVPNFEDWKTDDLTKHQIIYTNIKTSEQIKVPNVWYNRPNKPKSFLPSYDYLKFEQGSPCWGWL